MASGVNSKYMAGTVGSLTSLTPASGVSLASDGVLEYRKTGPLVELYGFHVKPNNSIASDGSVLVGTMPDGYRPKMFRAIFSAGSGAKMGGQIVIGSGSGNITFYNGNSTAWSTSTYFNFYCIYIEKNS